MNPDSLFDRLRAYGADMDGINDRFMGDESLYAQCLLELLEEQGIAALGEAIASDTHRNAFELAHALKGLSGNLGLTPFYDAICVLVESLRISDFRDVNAQYAAVEREFSRLVALNAGEPFEALPTAADVPASKAGGEAPAPAAQKRTRPKRKPIDRVVALTLAILIGVIALFSALFLRLIRDYRQSVENESAQHLIELCHQMQIYVETRTESCWRIARSVANSLSHRLVSDDATTAAYLDTVCALWGVSDIVVYTEDGSGVSAKGAAIPHDEAAVAMALATRKGEYLSIADSTLSFTLPVQTELRLRGQKVAALSIRRDVGSYLDDMGITSFDGAGYLYLVQSDGVVISKLSHPNAPAVFNIKPLIEAHDLTPLTPGPWELGGLFDPAEAVVCLLHSAPEPLYVVSTPIKTQQQELYLLYFVPENTVNRTLEDFSDYVTIICVGAIIFIAAGCGVIFTFILHARKRRFDREIVERERMFDLLTKNTRAAFGLFSLDADAPLYISANAASVVGEDFVRVVETDAGPRLKGRDEVETDNIRTLNTAMAGWDGTEPFRSGYLLNASTAAPSYYCIELYPVGEACREFVGIARDVSEMFAREEATRNALAMAESSNAAKTQFLSNMSHDMRTPMNAIVNMTDFALANLHDTKKLTDYLNTIRSSSTQLLQLVNDILDMSRIASGQSAIESKPIDLVEELTKAAAIIRPLCQAKAQNFQTTFNGLETPMVLGDAKKLSQILLNLLSNAVKFTPVHGSVRLAAVELSSLSPDMAVVRFAVEDDGIGIAQSDIPHIFDPFRRVDEERTGEIEGTGLGLAICKSYVDAMGGTISCTSTPGLGSLFSVVLTFQKTKGGPKPRRLPITGLEDKKPFAGLRCLVCEDNHTNRVIAQTMLERLGFIVALASDGREGFA